MNQRSSKNSTSDSIQYHQNIHDDDDEDNGDDDWNSYDPKLKYKQQLNHSHNNNNSSSSSERAPLIRYQSGKEVGVVYQTTGQTATRRRNTSKSPDIIPGSSNYNSTMRLSAHNSVYSPSQRSAEALRATRTLTFDDQSTLYPIDDNHHSIRESRSTVSEVPQMARQMSDPVPRHQRNHQDSVTPNRLRLLGEADLPHEVYSVRKRALTVMEPLMNTWLIISIGVSTSVGLAAARFLHLLPTLPFWIIFLPSLISHFGVLFVHIRSARNLSRFISDTNDGRQRSDSRDHLDRTEYLPLLQRSLKFGLKTGSLCFLLFIFQLLLYLHLSAEQRNKSADQGTFTLNTCLLPVWILVIGGICDGVVCKTQSFLRLVCWSMAFASMSMLVLKLDYGFDEYTWTTILFPVAIILLISGGSLIYVLYGHQLGYFQLTENQYMAGIMYCISIFMMLCLCVVLSEVIPGMIPDMQTRLFVVILAPLVVGLIGLGAWGVSKDEYKRMLLLGGQQSVHPMRLRLEPAGWTCVESRGVALFPMFGEVSYEPLDYDKTESIEMCICCSVCQCYPFEEKDRNEVAQRYQSPQMYDASPSRAYEDEAVSVKNSVSHSRKTGTSYQDESPTDRLDISRGEVA